MLATMQVESHTLFLFVVCFPLTSARRTTHALFPFADIKPGQGLYYVATTNGWR